jgi:hypothetical protein
MNNSPFDMWWMVIIEIKISAGVGGFSVNLRSQSRSSFYNQNVQERVLSVRFYFHNKLDGRSQSVEVCKKVVYPLCIMRPDHKCDLHIGVRATVFLALNRQLDVQNVACKYC